MNLCLFVGFCIILLRLNQFKWVTNRLSILSGNDGFVWHLAQISVRSVVQVATDFHYHTHWFSISSWQQFSGLLDIVKGDSAPSLLTRVSKSCWGAMRRSWCNETPTDGSEHRGVETLCLSLLAVFSGRFYGKRKSIDLLYIRTPYIWKRAELEKQYSLDVPKPPVWCS